MHGGSPRTFPLPRQRTPPLPTRPEHVFEWFPSGVRHSQKTLFVFVTQRESTIASASMGLFGANGLSQMPHKRALD